MVRCILTFTLLIGERKAIFEDCESEKTENKDRIKKLKDEVRDLQAEVQASNKSSEGILRHVQVFVLLLLIILQN